MAQQVLREPTRSRSRTPTRSRSRTPRSALPMSWYDGIERPRVTAAFRDPYDPWQLPSAEFYPLDALDLRDYPHNWSDILVMTYQKLELYWCRDLNVGAVLFVDKNAAEELLDVLWNDIPHTDDVKKARGEYEDDTQPACIGWERTEPDR